MACLERSGNVIITIITRTCARLTTILATTTIITLIPNLEVKFSAQVFDDVLTRATQKQQRRRVRV